MNPPIHVPPDPAAARETRRRALGHFFAPENIAVIGASPKEASVGRALLENLFEFGGRVFPVNPSHATVMGIPAFARIADVPAKVDLAVIATPARVAPDIIRECGEAGVKAAIIHSAGFKECGPAGVELENRVLVEARKGGVRVIGPNCLGLMAPHARLNATFASTIARPGNVAFISQSGALCSAVLDWSLSENVGFSALVSVGSMLDVGWAELITSLGDDPRTHSILIYMESIGDARAFLSAAREVAFTKPIIVVKAGRTAAAAKAAASHTGALQGSDAVMDAAFRRAGVLRVDTIEDLFDMAEVLGKQPRPRGPRLGIVTNAGGPAALAVDCLVSGGGEVAPLSPQTIEALDRVLPAHWSRGNPVDVLGDADDVRLAKAVELVARDPATDGVLVVLTPQAMSDALGAAERVREFAAAGGDKPLLASWMGGAAVAAGQACLNAAGIPTFPYPDRAARAFNDMWRYSANLNSLYETPVLLDGATRPGGGTPLEADAIIGRAREHHRVLLTEYESKALIAAYGIPTVEACPAFSEDEAVEAATRIGFPVAVKLHSETITHKSDVGGVRLYLQDAADVRVAWRAIHRAVADKVGAHHFQGVTVERMLLSDGIELILGSSIDAQFGPVLLFGAGGRWVEVTQDRAIGLPPLTSTLARRLMEQTRVYHALKGARGRAPFDLPGLERTLVRFSQLVAEQRWIKEIDINPLLVSADRIVALDARIILHDSSLPEAKLPALAIRPYPTRYTTSHTLRDGAPVVIRSIRPEDEPLMVRFHQTLSDQSVYQRYLSGFSLEQRTLHTRLARLCFIDYDREVALVAVHKEPGTGNAELIAVARLHKAHGQNEAELAVVVADRWQRRGVGTLLVGQLSGIAREERLLRITGVFLAENAGMRRLCERAGFKIRRRPGDQLCEATLAL